VIKICVHLPTYRQNKIGTLLPHVIRRDPRFDVILMAILIYGIMTRHWKSLDSHKRLKIHRWQTTTLRQTSCFLTLLCSFSG